MTNNVQKKLKWTKIGNKWKKGKNSAKIAKIVADHPIICKHPSPAYSILQIIRTKPQKNFNIWLQYVPIQITRATTGFYHRFLAFLKISLPGVPNARFRVIVLGLLLRVTHSHAFLCTPFKNSFSNITYCHSETYTVNWYNLVTIP